MADIRRQYVRLQKEIDHAMQGVLVSTAFINGAEVKAFADELAAYMEIAHVIPCGNGTDALHIAFMALELQPQDEIIMPAFNYIASAEMAVLNGQKPIFVDVSPDTFMLNPEGVEAAITCKTRAIVAVNLFGQVAPLEPLRTLADKHHLFLIEDHAQSLGSNYRLKDGTTKKGGTLGDLNITSFFPSKNLGCFGDGGALLTQDATLADRAKTIASHGWKEKYNPKRKGMNSRLDTLQAAVLRAKLPHLDDFCQRRESVAEQYHKHLSSLEEIVLPVETQPGEHTYNQFTLRVLGGKRDAFQKALSHRGIPSAIYYPYPQHHLLPYQTDVSYSLPIAEQLCQEVLSLPIHTEMTQREVDYIVENIKYIANKLY